MLLRSAVPLLLVGCGGPTPSDTTPPADTSIPTVIGGDDSEQETADTSVEPEVSDVDWQAAWFDEAQIHEVVLTIPTDSWADLRADPYEFVVANATFDGELVGELGLRLRGKVGSFRTIDQKPKFKMDFGEFVDGQDLHGLKSMSLNNEVVDCSYLKEPLGYRVFRDAGLAASRTSFAHVMVNDEDYGLYVVVEVPDAKFLTDRFPGDDTGQLYDGKYLYYDDGSYILLDFATGVDALFQLEEGEDTGNAEIFAISDAIGAHGRPGPGFAEALDGLVDWQELHTNFAVEQWIGHVDGYAMNRNNYRVYFRPSDGKMILMPWDFDYAFIEDYAWGMSWNSPTGMIANHCWRDPDCLAGQPTAMAAVLETIDTEALLTWYDELSSMTGQLAEDDPKRECGIQSVHRERAALRTWIETRSDAMRTAWGLE